MITITKLFVLLICLGVAPAYAETSLYAIVTSAGDAGYTTGTGLQFETSHVYKFLEVAGYAKYSVMKKKHAESGYTYGYGIQGNAHIYNGFYASVANAWSGYKSKFANGSVWEKSGSNFTK